MLMKSHNIDFNTNERDVDAVSATSNSNYMAVRFGVCVNALQNRVRSAFAANWKNFIWRVVMSSEQIF